MVQLKHGKRFVEAATHKRQSTDPAQMLWQSTIFNNIRLYIVNARWSFAVLGAPNIAR